MAQYGTQLSTQGLEIGLAQGGIDVGTSSVVGTSAAPVGFDFSTNTSTSISAANPITPFNFGVNDPSAVTGTQTVTGFDFSINTASSIAGTGAPIFDPVNTNFFAGGTTGSFTVEKVGGLLPAAPVTVNLTDDIQSLQALITNINVELAANGPIGVVAREDPANLGRLQFVATDQGVNTTITIDNYAGAGNASPAVITSLIGIIAGDSNAAPSAGVTGVRGSLTAATFTVEIAGGSGMGGTQPAVLNLDQNIANGDVASLVTDLNNQLAAVATPPGIDVRVREDPQNAGLIQFYATTLGEPSTVTVRGYTPSANVTGDTVATLAVQQKTPD